MNKHTYTLTIDSDVDGSTLNQIVDRALFGLTEDLWSETDQRWTVTLTNSAGEDTEYTWTPDTIGLTQS
jgi:hypothetical protein